MQEYMTQEVWASEIGMEQEWVEAPCSLPMIEYSIELTKLHHNHSYLEDISNILMQHTHRYKTIITSIINVPINEIPTIMSTRYWFSAPQVQPMIPGTMLGYFRISGTYMVNPEE